ncbi:hypothetical protein [Bradyrhizobium sp. SZCCHNS2002]|uniref:hypothetical protein n=1 Tax=Bradyrhizobium sp. SZCCHNS2002 TaxID=3057302 RepID=UPI0029160EF8|nr:hypothetical protein [Bradyrhizobium sp. SZCCHNS2002]
MNRTQKSRPTHTVYVVEGEGDSTYWTKIGAAWAHDDGEGYNISLTALPLNGRLVVRTAKTDAKKEAGR